MAKYAASTNILKIMTAEDAVKSQILVLAENAATQPMELKAGNPAYMNHSVLRFTNMEPALSVARQRIKSVIILRSGSPVDKIVQRQNFEVNLRFRQLLR